MVVDELVKKVESLEQKVQSIEVQQFQMRATLDSTEATLAKVNTNTQDLVDLIKGGKVATRLFLWAVGIIGGIVALGEYLGWKHGS